MQTNTNAPFFWLKQLVSSLEWPLVVGAAFVLGRYVNKLETRLKKAETSITALVERHMPAIHRALAEIRGMLYKD